MYFTIKKKRKKNTRLLGPTPRVLGREWVWISIEFPGEAAGPGATVWEPLSPGEQREGTQCLGQIHAPNLTKPRCTLTLLVFVHQLGEWRTTCHTTTFPPKQHEMGSVAVPNFQHQCSCSGSWTGFCLWLEHVCKLPSFWSQHTALRKWKQKVPCPQRGHDLRNRIQQLAG